MEREGLAQAVTERSTQVGQGSCGQGTAGACLLHCKWEACKAATSCYAAQRPAWRHLSYFEIVLLPLMAAPPLEQVRELEARLQEVETAAAAADLGRRQEVDALTAEVGKRGSSVPVSFPCPQSFIPLLGLKSSILLGR